MGRLIDADKVMGFQFYDEEKEEWYIKEMSIIDFLETYSVDTISIVPKAEKKRGHWVKLTEKSAMCSECGLIVFSNGIDKTEHATIITGLYPYCPTCESYMR